jgi:hypothetical protein
VRLFLRFKPEIAMRGSFHHGPSPRQFHLGIEAVDHRVIAIAMEQITQIGQAQAFVELGVTTACHIEIEVVLGRGDDLDIETAAPGPDLLGNRL